VRSRPRVPLSKGATTGKVEEIGMVPVLEGYGHVVSDDHQDAFDHFLCVREMQGDNSVSFTMMLRRV
jgi:hypothetical protein